MENKSAYRDSEWLDPKVFRCLLYILFVNTSHCTLDDNNPSSSQALLTFLCR